MRPEYLDTFPGAVVGFVVDEMRRTDLGATMWDTMSEEQRQERLDMMAIRADQLAQKLVDDVLTAGARKIQGTVDQVVFKDGIKVVVKCSKLDSFRHELADTAGQSIMLVIPQLAIELVTSANSGERQNSFNLLPDDSSLLKDAGRDDE